MLLAVLLCSAFAGSVAGPTGCADGSSRRRLRQDNSTANPVIETVEVDVVSQVGAARSGSGRPASGRGRPDVPTAWHAAAAHGAWCLRGDAPPPAAVQECVILQNTSYDVDPELGARELRAPGDNLQDSARACCASCHDFEGCNTFQWCGASPHAIAPCLWRVQRRGQEP